MDSLSTYFRGLTIPLPLHQGPGDRDTRKVRFKPIKSEDDYELSRYKPLLQHVLTEHITGSLDQTAFAYVRDAPTSLASTFATLDSRSRAPSTASASSATSGPTSLRSGKRTWNRQPRTAVQAAGGSAAPEKEKEPIRQRVIVFVAGGVTYSELRVAYEVGTQMKRDVYIGESLELAMISTRVFLPSSDSCYLLIPWPKAKLYACQFCLLTT